MIRQLDIMPGSLVVVTADLTRLALTGRRLDIGFNIDNFIDTLKQCLGKGGTLVIPSFNFNLGNGDHYDPLKTIPITGALAVAAMKRLEFIRTKHPLHSFLAWGDHAEALAALNNKSSFAADSPFAYFREHNGIMLLIDTTITDAFTFVHHVEEMEGVGYRRYRKIWLNVEGEAWRHGGMEAGKRGSGEAGKHGSGEEGKRGMREVLLYAKKAGWTMDLRGLEQLLFEEKAAKKIIYKQVAFTLVDLQAAYPVIQDDIRHNKARNLARFSLDLYLREKAKTALGAVGIHTLNDKISHDPGLL
jgi:aminoglycoside 3-N-acetyltransferase